MTVVETTLYESHMIELSESHPRLRVWNSLHTLDENGQVTRRPQKMLHEQEGWKLLQPAEHERVQNTKTRVNRMQMFASTPFCPGDPATVLLYMIQGR